MNTFMKCGHSAQGTHKGAHDGLPADHPSCVICFGMDAGSCTPVDVLPDLGKRKARCTYYGRGGFRNFGPIYPDDKSLNNGRCSRGRCLCEVGSDITLPFFGRKLDKEFDEFFCGCAGWG